RDAAESLLRPARSAGGTEGSARALSARAGSASPRVPGDRGGHSFRSGEQLRVPDVEIRGRAAAHASPVARRRPAGAGVKRLVLIALVVVVAAAPAGAA